MKYFLIITLLSLSLTSCTQDDILYRESDSRSYKSHKIDLHQALDKANNMYNDLFKGDSARASNTFEITNVEYVRHLSTRSSYWDNQIDTMFYIVNFKNGGFAILSADDRTRPIYAISNEASVNLSDTIHNKGLLLFLTNSEYDFNKSVSEFPSLPIDTIKEPIIGTDIGDYPSFIHKKPRLKSNVMKWGQGSPFNKYCFTLNGR